MLNSRLYFSIVFIFTALVLLAAAYFQFVKGLEPCPLCIMQRIVFLMIGIIAIIAMIHNPYKSGSRIYSGLVVLFSLAGIYFSGKQVWLQHLPPDQVPACGPGLNVLIANFPITDILHELFFGGGQCAEVDWSFLGLSLAGWAFVLFILLLLFGLWQIINLSIQKNKHHSPSA